MPFAPLACNSFGQQAPEMLGYQWIVADRAAQRVVSLPDFSLPAAADLPGVVDEHASLLQLYQRRSQRFFRQSVQEVWWLFLKGYVSESLAAPSLSSPILNTLIFSAAVLFRGSLTFLVDPASLSPGAVSPQSPPPSPGPHSLGGGLGDSHSLWQVQVVNCSQPPSALCGPAHRSRGVPPTTYLGGGFRLFTSGGARAPGRAPLQGVPGGASPCPPTPFLVGAARALPLPVPAPAPLLARLGVLTCEAVFSRPVLLRRFAAPCDLPCSFPCF